ncbi:hypothetical protein [Pyrococcus abyssi]|uniref:Uncharacterized protein n=1 Tax=Pyrococcus abyssi (strain GE5 / Orsay) TaxID=272844 RepID=Q9UZ97_PYRAB|nr:hypothetical protein [Pyrococcus abyssi]CAB50162.1 Hypothetical protein PAB0831 [Pyrococcus abyssi GE5]CCE70694.1 TPA: hypothetical protein PAB0831 [Pyrococcus abyssi GE5]
MLEILSFMFFTGGGLVMLYIAAFASTNLIRIAALLGALGYGMLGFLVAESMSLDIRRKSRRSDRNVILAITLISFGLNYYALYAYTHSNVAPILLMGPGLVIGLWTYAKAK